MSNQGFWITRLTLTGSNVPVAEVQFRKGLNVVSGPSNTGKTYIAQCIDYMLGRRDKPKDIPETTSYELVSLEFRSELGEAEFLFERSLQGGDIRLHMNGGIEQTLRAKHQADDQDTVSYFLLDLSGLAGRKVRTNKQGNTRSLSFRDIARLMLVDEEVVISERSPIFTGQVIHRTVESCIFRLLLTGVDDSTVIKKEDTKITRSRQDAKAEVLDDLINRVRDQLVALGLNGGHTFVRAQMESAEALFDQASEDLKVERRVVEEIEDRRREAWTRLRKVESRLDVLSQLQRHFELLQEQYLSDLRRLEAVSEVGTRLGQMREERCPVCGALAEHHSRPHQRLSADPEEVLLASRAEAAKIRILMSDLKVTLVENGDEVERLTRERDQIRSELEVISAEIRERVEPRLQAVLQRLQETQAQRDRLLRALDLFQQADQLERMQSETILISPSAPASGPATIVGSDEAEIFSKEVEALLRAWHFPNLDRVTFSEQDQDVVISGRRRASHGKGVRAITHAAFNLALLKYCLSKSMPHPNIVLIDSPLVVYREPDTDESGFAPDVKDAFYRSLANDFMESQVIILENEDPPADIREVANVIHFTGSATGRSGFIPTSDSPF
jgi:hypothetical protein